jgi:hypothetical protein
MALKDAAQNTKTLPIIFQNPGRYEIGPPETNGRRLKPTQFKADVVPDE